MKLYNGGLYPGALAVVRFGPDMLSWDPDARLMNGRIVRLIQHTTSDYVHKMWQACGEPSEPTDGTWWGIAPDDIMTERDWWVSERYLHPLPPLDLREIERQAERVA